MTSSLSIKKSLKIKKKYNILNIILGIIFGIESIYILCKLQDNEFNKESIDTFINLENRSLFFIILFIFIVYLNAFALYFICKKTKDYLHISTKLLCIVILAAILISVEKKLSQNSNMCENRISADECMNQSKTGDLFFYRTYSSSDFMEFYISKILVCLISEIYMQHIGLVVVLDGEPYMCHFSFVKSYCAYSKKYKTGSCLTPLTTVLNDKNMSAHFIQSNIADKLNLDKDTFFAFLEKYKDFYYLQNATVCTTYLCDLFHIYGLMDPAKWFIRPYESFKPKHYNFDYKIFQCSQIDFVHP